MLGTDKLQQCRFYGIIARNMLIINEPDEYSAAGVINAVRQVS